ncbi:MAG: glutathione synthase [Pseudohongiellaceae bacterium]
MSVNLAVVMDPISSINYKKDTTLAMLLAAQKRGWKLFYMEQRDLYYKAGEPMALMQPLQVQANPGKWFSLGEQEKKPLTAVDVVLMRKDPPFDNAYVYSTYILEAAERKGTLIINKPQSLRDCNEKFFATQFPQCCPDLVVSSHKDILKEFYNTHSDVIFKPLDGMGGTSVFRLKHGDPNVSVIIETLTHHGQNQIMAQTYIPEISAGDKRILMINGQATGYSLARIPAANETRGNLAAGGSAVGLEMTQRDHWICEQVGPTLKEKGLVFVGLDVIGDYLTEINVTSPTCVRELDEAFGLDIAGDLMDCIQEKLET